MGGSDRTKVRPAMRHRAIASACLVIAALGAACGGSSPSDDLVGVTWEWRQLTEAEPASQSVVADPQNYTLVFAGEESVYYAKADCNQLRGAYELSDDSLTLKPGPMTLAMCAPESSSDLYVSLLAQVDGYRLDGDQLVLTFGGGAGEMMFANVGPAQLP